MNGLLNQAFGLGELGFGTPGSHLAFERPIASWAWAVVLIAAAATAWWSYRRLSGGRWSRAALGAARALVLALIVVLIAGPRLERPNTRIENDRVVVLLDRSGSITVRDEDGRTSRDERLRSIAASLEAALVAAEEPKDSIWLGFDGSAYELAGGPGDLEEPAGRRTSIDAALQGALRSAAGRPLSAVVLVSDGRTTEAASAETLRRLTSDRVPVFTIALGSPTPPADLALTRVEAPSVAFTGDRVPVRAEVTVSGGAGEGPGGASVELIDESTGQRLATAPLDRAEWIDDSTAAVVLLADPGDAGEKAWTVRVVSNQPDLEPGNDARELSMELVDRPIRVLHIDGYPRWEFRFVRGLLLREPSIRSTSLMLAPDRRFLQEGDVTLREIPESAEGWSEFDAVILGDLRPELLGEAALESLREHVAERGAGLMWIAGPDVAIGSWSTTALGDLLPVAAGRLGEGGRLPVWDRDVVLSRGIAAERRGLLALDDDGISWPPGLADPATGWSRLRWAQRIDRALVKPGAETLAVAVPIELAPASGTEAESLGSPAVLVMRYGAGRSIYVATEETWRWRYGRGEDLQERFWLPLTRLLARGRVERTGRAAVLSISPEDPSVGAPVRVSVELVDQSLIDAAPETIAVAISRGTEAPASLTLAPVGEGRRRFAGIWSAPEAGSWTLRPDEPLLADLALEGLIEARWPDDERRDPAADHDLLERLANVTGGATLADEELSGLAGRLPNRRVVLDAAPDVASLWDRPVVLAVMLLLLAAEWAGRKFLRLV